MNKRIRFSGRSHRFERQEELAERIVPVRAVQNQRLGEACW